jgi:glycosyltransferase involved in cell wall biosynthesis
LPKISHANLREHFWNADVVVDQFSRYGVFGVTTLEAIACGRPTLTHASSQYDEFKDFPLKDCNNVENVVENIEKASKELWEKEYAYLNKYHSPQKIGKKLADLYSQLSKK